MTWVRDVSSLYDFIGYVVLRAPDHFPREDYLKDPAVARSNTGDRVVSN